MSAIKNARRFVFGQPIATKHAHHQRLSNIFALPVFASDALSSVAYATEQTMWVLAGAAGSLYFRFTFPISIAIVVLIVLVATSYYQTIHAYPHGGGSYTVASDNLGSIAGRIAGASLLIDYVLTVAVSVTAGVLALVSIWPVLQGYVVELDVLAVALIAVVNLRGTKESGVVFAIPTYTFVFLTLFMIGFGLLIFLPHHPNMPQLGVNHQKVMASFGLFLILRAFANGCTALTGIEAISNGVQAFRKPESRNASITLGVMAGMLIAMFVGSSWLAQHLHVIPMNQDDPGYKTVLALICSRIFGTGAYFWALQIATALILILAANTAFADFPRLSSIIARDNFLPRQLASVGDRLVFQNGIIALAILSTILIIAFKGHTDALIPLYAIGVFTAFTLSQFGMVVHQIKQKKYLTVPISLIGGMATAVVTAVILITKTTEGGWIVLVMIAVMLFLFSRIHKHYEYLARELSLRPDDQLVKVKTTVLLLVPRMHRGILHAISYASEMTDDLRAIHVTLDPQGTKQIREDWNRFGVDIPLVILDSPYRSLTRPITEYIDEMIRLHPDMMITVVVPQAVPKHWWQGLLHNNAAIPLKMALQSRKNVVITNVRYFLQ
jgi:amino acid transporter